MLELTKIMFNAFRLVVIFVLVLTLFTVTEINGQLGYQLKLFPKDDAFVVTDLNDPNNTYGLNDLNSGHVNFLKLWNAWNTTEENEQIISMAYMKFDISKLEKDKIVKADLKLHANLITKEGGSIVNLSLLESNSWKEETVTFGLSPPLNSISIISTHISQPNAWYGWDITNFVKETTDPQISLALMIDTLKQNEEEIVVFNSKESDNTEMIPYLSVLYVGQENPLETDDSDNPFSTMAIQDSEILSNDTYITIAAVLGAVGGFVLALFLTSKGIFNIGPQRNLKS